MKKITLLVIGLMMTISSTFAYKVYAWVNYVVRPGCVNVHVVVVDIDENGQESVVVSGDVNVGPECGFTAPTPVPGSPTIFADYINNNTNNVHQHIAQEMIPILNRMKRIKDVKIIPNPVQNKTINYSFNSPFAEVVTVEVIDPVSGNIDHTTTLPASNGMNNGQIIVPSYVSGTKKVVFKMSNGDGAIVNNIVIE